MKCIGACKYWLMMLIVSILALYSITWGAWAMPIGLTWGIMSYVIGGKILKSLVIK